MVLGGVVVVDDYTSVPGATDAVDEFLANKNVRLEKLHNYQVPSFFVKK